MGSISQDLKRNDPRTTDLQIIEMEGEDIEEVLNIENRCFRSPWTRIAFEQELGLKWSKVFVAKKSPFGEKRIVGYICLWLVTDEVHILNLATHPDFRRQEIATRLITSALEFSIRSGAKAATLEVRESNLCAISLYKKFGFEAKGVRPRYYSDNFEDGIVMWLSLRSQEDSSSLKIGE
ncbi:MAG: ribosomal protein S18-alanine N-acetyltransferase [Pseudomonadota bacterium]